MTWFQISDTQGVNLERIGVFTRNDDSTVTLSVRRMIGVTPSAGNTPSSSSKWLATLRRVYAVAALAKDLSALAR